MALSSSTHTLIAVVEGIGGCRDTVTTSNTSQTDGYSTDNLLRELDLILYKTLLLPNYSLNSDIFSLQGLLDSCNHVAVPYNKLIHVHTDSHYTTHDTALF